MKSTSVKRTLALLLALVMMLGLYPATAIAGFEDAETEPEFFEPVAEEAAAEPSGDGEAEPEGEDLSVTVEPTEPTEPEETYGWPEDGTDAGEAPAEEAPAEEESYFPAEEPEEAAEEEAEEPEVVAVYEKQSEEFVGL